MSLALTGRTFLDLWDWWDWWDCLSKSELIKLSWFSAQPSMNLHSSRYTNQMVFRIQITKFKNKFLKLFHYNDCNGFQGPVFQPLKKDGSKKVS